MKDNNFRRPFGKGAPRDDGMRINHQIRAPQVRLIDDEGKMLGVYAPAEALRMAQDKGLDLIEIAPNATPPTCKIMDYGKWKYENKKKDKISKKKQTVIVLKEVQVRPRTDQHDLDVKLRAARKFLLEGNKVKFNMRFSGREMAHTELGMKLLEKVIATLNDLCILEQSPKREGRQMHLVMGPDPIKVKEYRRLHPELDKKKVATEEEVEAMEAKDAKEAAADKDDE